MVYSVLAWNGVQDEVIPGRSGLASSDKSWIKIINDIMPIEHAVKIAEQSHHNGSVNSKRQHPPGQPPGFCTYFQPGSRDLYHLNCAGVTRGSNLLSIIISTKLSVDAA